MNIPKILTWSAGLALVLTATVLTAQPRMMGHGPAAACGPMMRFLDLTEAQQTSLKAIEARHQASLDAKLKTAGEAREAMRTAMHDPAVSDAKVQELHTRVAEAMSAVMLERRAMHREFEAILTPDQKAALEKQHAAFGPGMGRGHGHGGCGFGGGF